MLSGFKKFILKGNVIDLAVAVVIGSAFSAVVDALVKSVLMPLISVLVGEPNFDDFLAFGDVRFGVLLTAVVNFLLVASALYFVIVAPMNRLRLRIRRRRSNSGPVQSNSVIVSTPSTAARVTARQRVRAAARSAGDTSASRTKPRSPPGTMKLKG